MLYKDEKQQSGMIQVVGWKWVTIMDKIRKSQSLHAKKGLSPTLDVTNLQNQTKAEAFHSWDHQVLVMK